MSLAAEIAAVLSDSRRGAEDFCDVEAIEALIPRFGWLSVLSAMLDILSRDGGRDDDYRLAMNVIWGGACDQRPIPADRVIALLYHRFDPRGDAEDNLVWSITSKLRGIDYLSDYKPLQDPKVQAELEAIRRGA